MEAVMESSSKIMQDHSKTSRRDTFNPSEQEEEGLTIEAWEFEKPSLVLVKDAHLPVVNVGESMIADELWPEEV
jgi:hypothetical protein